MNTLTERQFAQWRVNIGYSPKQLSWEASWFAKKGDYYRAGIYYAAALGDLPLLRKPSEEEKIRLGLAAVRAKIVKRPAKEIGQRYFHEGNLVMVVRKQESWE